MHFYTMPTTPRTAWGADYVRRYYRTTDRDAQRKARRYPRDRYRAEGRQAERRALLADFAELADWAKENTTSAIYSCLAVHGVVLHADGVERHRLAEQMHRRLRPDQGRRPPSDRRTAPTFRTPHARWNEVREQDLSDCGYSILSKSTETGVDCFVKQQKKSLFVHFQGHPEYEAQCLLGEYRRDLRSLPPRRERCLSDDTEGVFGRQIGTDHGRFSRQGPVASGSRAVGRLPSRADVQGGPECLAFLGHPHLPQLAFVHGNAAYRTHPATAFRRAGPRSEYLYPTTGFELTIRCREIGTADLDAIADLLTRGFAIRSHEYWMRGLQRQSVRDVPEGYPRFGYMLDYDSKPVGVLLLIYTARDNGAGVSIRCNLSSWYVEPAFRHYAPMLSRMAQRHKHVSYVNISPANWTWPTIEAQGFRR